MDDLNDIGGDGIGGRARMCLLNMCGLPGAGKSTIARALAAHLNDNGTKRDGINIRVSVVSFDDIEKQLALQSSSSPSPQHQEDAEGRSGGGHPTVTTGSAANLVYDAALWRAARKEAFSRLTALLTEDDEDKEGKRWERAAQAEEATEEGMIGSDTNTGTSDGCRGVRGRRYHLVIADDNFYYASMRYQVHLLARRVSAAHVQLYVEVALETAHLRNALRIGTDRVPRDALDRMAAAIEPPNLATSRLFERTRTAVVAAAVAGDNDTAAVAVSAWERVYALWGVPPPIPATEDEREVRALQAAHDTSYIEPLQLHTSPQGHLPTHLALAATWTPLQCGACCYPMTLNTKP
jgi:O-phosphoseryl-tRNA(Sec) kinase